MRKILLTLLFSGIGLFLATQTSGQLIQGWLSDSMNDRPLAYVNVGVINTSRGTITNEAGAFKLSCKDLPLDAMIRFSMIGYEPQIFSVQELLGTPVSVRLVKQAIELEEVSIAWKGTTRQVGTSKTSKTGGVCGWGGTQFGRGHELGILLNTGNSTAKINDLKLRVHKQSFDTIVFRLHIRSLQGGMPSRELLTENIYLNIYEYSGWQTIDLSAYDIYVSGDIVLSLEWIRISNVIEENLVKMNKDKKATAVVLFNVSKKSGTLFSRRGSEAKWRKEENTSPGFYISLKE